MKLLLVISCVNQFSEARYIRNVIGFPNGKLKKTFGEPR